MYKRMNVVDGGARSQHQSRQNKTETDDVKECTERTTPYSLQPPCYEYVGADSISLVFLIRDIEWTGKSVSDFCEVVHIVLT